LHTAVGTSTAREEEHLVACRASGVEVEASLSLCRFASTNFASNCEGETYQSADEKGRSGDVVVDPGSDNIPSLIGASIALNRRDGRKVLAEIARVGVN